MEQSEGTKDLINALEDSTLAQIKIGVKIRVCATFNSHPEPGMKKQAYYKDLHDKFISQAQEIADQISL